jgi:flagellar biosynthesis protein FlhA
MSDVRNLFNNAFLQQRSDLLVAGGVIMVVIMLIIPLPAVILDTLMAMNLIVTLLTILIVLYMQRALDFSVFPTLLLVLTVFGLALNVSSTRLILSQGSQFGGQIVRAFSEFVVGTTGVEGIVIGLIIFTIIISVQWVVITKGATRVAEVAARFTLDALPAKQMSIEAEYNSGALTEEEANQKKLDLEREADFYGAMDGASKFVSGNVKVGILITLINMIGGIVVGMTIHNESFNTALNTYVALAIGDGLVTQFPALFVSTATGLIVTRAISDGTFGQDVTKQFGSQSRIYWIAAVFLLVMSVLPGFPWYILLPIAGLLMLLAYRLGQQKAREEAAAKEEEEGAAQPEEPTEMSPVAPLDPLSLELGYGLVPLVDKDKGAELLDRITRIRRETALELGLVVPRIRIIDNMRLNPSEYCFKIRGVEVGRGTIRLGHYLCINPGGVTEELPGEQTTDPAFGLPALWITEEYRDQAERAGYTVVDAPSIVATHLTEIIKRYAADILGRQEVKSILETMRKDYSAAVEEVQANLAVGEIQKVLQGLLREQVSIRNMVVVLETLADYGSVTKDTSFLIEKVRQALSRQISLQHADDSKTMHVITLDPDLEQQIIDSRVETAGGVVPALQPDVQRQWINSLTNTVRSVQEQGYSPVVLCSEAARPLVKASARRDLPDLVVLSVPEIVSEVKVEAVAQVELNQAVR